MAEVLDSHAVRENVLSLNCGEFEVSYFEITMFGGVVLIFGNISCHECDSLGIFSGV